MMVQDRKGASAFQLSRRYIGVAVLAGAGILLGTGSENPARVLPGPRKVIPQ